MFVNGLGKGGGEALGAFDRNVVDGAVNGAGWLTRFASRVSMWWDTWIVDGAVRLGSFSVKLLSYPVCILQTGRVQATRCSSWWACWSSSDTIWRVNNERPLTQSGAVHAAGGTVGPAVHSRRARKSLIKVWANLASFAGFLISLPLVSRFDKGASRISVRRARQLDSHSGRAISDRHRWHQPAADHADHRGRVHRHPVFVERYPGPAERILLHVPAAASGHAGRIHVDGFLPVLRVLGTGAGAHVLHHRRVGRTAQTVCGHQVLPLHAGRFGADAAGHSDAVLPVRQPVRQVHF